MAIKLYLHIGHPKCGSSTLQQALFDNRRTLLNAGIGVVNGDFGLMKPTTKKPAYPLAFFRELLQDLAEIEEEEERDQRAFDTLDAKFAALAATAESQGLHAVVLSAENLARPPAIELLTTAKAYFDCEILYYIRRHDDWLISSWLQWQFKTGISLEAFVDQTLRSERKFLFRHVLESCLKHFGQDALRLRVLYRLNLEGGDLVSDFWSAIGVNVADMAPTVARNVSFSADLVSVLKESPYLFDGSHDNALTAFIEQYHANSPGGRKRNPLTKDRRQEILAKFRPEIRWIRETFFQPEDLTGWMVVHGNEEDGDGPEAVSREGLAEMLNLQLAALKDLREDMDKIKKRLGIR